MKQVIILLIMLIPFTFFCFYRGGGSDITMDYSSLHGSGISPQEYDDLVRQRQSQYAEENKDEDV